jgi:hypothetical protein
MSLAKSSGLFQEEHRVVTEGSDSLYVRMMHPKPPHKARRLVFITPLVGGTATQPLILLRNLARRGSILMSFEYRGHPRSTGVFDLEKTIVDSRHALLWAADHAAQVGLPLHGFAFCYGAYTLASQFIAGGPGPRLHSFSTISGLFRLDQLLRFEHFVPVLSRHLGQQLDAAGFLEAIESGAIDTGSLAFRAALHEYLKATFPQLRVGEDYFEELHYTRADIPSVLWQVAHADHLARIDLPREMPCNFFFGYRDDLFALDTPEGRQSYRGHIQSLIPHAHVHGADIDHFGFGPEHDALVQRVGDLFEQHDKRSALACSTGAENQAPSPVPPPHVQESHLAARCGDQSALFFSGGGLMPGKSL